MDYINNFRAEMEYWQDVVHADVVKWLFRPSCFAHQCIDGANGGLMSLTINGTTVGHLLTQFMQIEQTDVINGNIKVVDSCTQFHCNPTCP